MSKWWRIWAKSLGEKVGETDHIGNVLNSQNIKPVIKDCMKEELRYRTKNDHAQ